MKKQSFLVSLIVAVLLLTFSIGTFAEDSANTQSSTSSTISENNGSMYWPMPGYSVGRGSGSKFGMRVHPILGVYKLHTGVDIPAPGGTPIYAAKAGDVIDAGYKVGYGRCVTIDHGNNESTLYAHQSGIAVSIGQKVVRGEIIGYVGSTGFSTGNHLHFEVRINNVPQNPLNFLYQ